MGKSFLNRSLLGSCWNFSVELLRDKNVDAVYIQVQRDHLEHLFQQSWGEGRTRYAKNKFQTNIKRAVKTSTAR